MWCPDSLKFFYADDLVVPDSLKFFYADDLVVPDSLLLWDFDNVLLCSARHSFTFDILTFFYSVILIVW